METRLKRSKGWRTFGVKVITGMILSVLIIAVYANLFEAANRLDFVPLNDALTSGGSMGGRGNSDLVTALLLRAEGPVKIRRVENSSDLVEMVLTVDSEDLQVMLK